MTVRALAIDFTNCLAVNFIAGMDIVAHNERFLRAIKLGKDSDAQAFSSVKTFIASNRQSHILDTGNAGTTGSCFPLYQIISEELGSHFDPLLMADIHGGLADGVSLARAISADYVGPHAGSLFDASKLTTVYAQIHKVANEFPNEPIVYDLFDASRDRLTNLAGYFTRYPELLPSNVTFCLHIYAGAHFSQIGELEGTGIIDINYRQTVKHMAAITIEKQGKDGISAAINADEYVMPANLVDRRPIPEPLLGIMAKHAELINEGHTLAAEAASTLYKTLSSNITLLSSGAINHDQFQTNCAAAILTGKNEIALYSGWKELFANLSLFIAGYGIGVAAMGVGLAAGAGVGVAVGAGLVVTAGLANLAINRRLSFFKTDLANSQIDELQVHVDQYESPVVN